MTYKLEYYGLFISIFIGIFQTNVNSLDCVEYEVDSRKHVLCEGKNNFKTAIPKDIPPETNHLTLRDHSINFISEDDFIKLTNLQSLTIESSNVERIHVNAFTSLKNLEVLNLRNNSLTFGLMGLPENLFRSLTSIKKIDLSENPLGTIKWNNFEGLRYKDSLEYLNLSHVKSMDPLNITPKVFSSLTNLKVLDLSYTGLKTLNFEAEVMDMKSLEQLLVEGNPLRCDCKLLWLKRLVLKNHKLMTHHVNKDGFRSKFIYPATCHEPERFKGKYAFIGPDEYDFSGVLEENNFGCLPIMNTESTALLVQPFSEVSLFCNITSDTNGTMVWYRNEEKINEIKQKYQIQNHQFADSFRTILNISQFENPDAGVYRCEFKNDFGIVFADFNASIKSHLYPSFYSNQTVLVTTLIISILLICLAISTVVIFLIRFKQICTVPNPFKSHKKFCFELGKGHCYRKQEDTATMPKESDSLITADKTGATIINEGKFDILSPTMSPKNMILGRKIDGSNLNDCLYVSCDGPEPRIFLNSDSIDSKSPQILPTLLTSNPKNDLITPKPLPTDSATLKNSIYATVNNPYSLKASCPLHGVKTRSSTDSASINRESTISPKKTCPVHGNKDSGHPKEELKLKSSLKSPKSINSVSSSSTLPTRNRAKIASSFIDDTRKTKNGVIFKSIVELSSSSCQEFSSHSSINSNRTASSITDSTNSFADRKSEKDYEFYLDRLSKHSQISLANLNNNNNNSTGKNLNSSSSSLLRLRSSITNINIKPNLYPVESDTLWNSKKILSQSSTRLNEGEDYKNCLIGTEIIIKEKSLKSMSSRQSISNISSLVRAGSKHKLDDPYDSEHSSVD